MNLPYLAGWIGSWLFFKICFRSRYFHSERVPRKGPAIIVSNHASVLDPPLIGAGVFRPLNFLARDTLFDVPVLRWWLRQWEVVPVDREGGGPGGLKGILDRLERGRAVVLFPEGTRSPDGRIHPARSGIGLVVVKSTAPVLPVRVFGTFEAYGRHRRFPAPHKVMVKYGEPLDVSDLRAEARCCSRERLRAIYRQVADEIMFRIARLEACRDKTAFP